MPKLILGPERRTHPLVWGAAFICIILAIAVIVTGLVVFTGYMIIRPRVPYINVTYAHLDNFYYGEAGQLNVQVTLEIKAVNDNTRAHASFSEIKFVLSFHGLQIAHLRADPFEVPRNDSLALPYVVPSLSIPLEREAREDVDASFKQNEIIFDLKGSTRTRWRVGVLGSVKFWSNLSCKLHFFASNGTSMNNYHCSSKSK